MSRICTTNWEEKMAKVRTLPTVGRVTRQDTKDKTPPFSLGLFLEALEKFYPDDKTSPGVIVSKLRSGEFYVAIHRYHQAYGEGRQVVMAQKHADLKTAIRNLASAWVESPVHELRRSLGR